ncbi:MAG: nucleotidyltransferase domain-containing protein [Vulcanimicrobiota bacterium]
MLDISDNEKTRVSAILNESVAAIKDITGPYLKKIILFGSYARKDYTSESDIDIMVLVDSDEDQIRELDNLLEDRIFDLSLKYDKILSVIVKNQSHFKKWSDVLPFYTNVENNGIVLYG